MRALFAFLLLLPQVVTGADIMSKAAISCVSGESKLMGRRTESIAQEGSDIAEARISEWVMKEEFGDTRSRVRFFWTPKSDKGPAIALETTDRPHNLVKIRSRTDSSLIVVSSTSNFYSAESWTFVLNFNVETMIATRVISNGNGVGSEQISYNCDFESLG